MSLAFAPWMTPSAPGTSFEGSKRCNVWSADGDHIIATFDSKHLSLEQNRLHARACAMLPHIVEFLLLLRDEDEVALPSQEMDAPMRATLDKLLAALGET